MRPIFGLPASPFLLLRLFSVTAVLHLCLLSCHKDSARRDASAAAKDAPITHAQDALPAPRIRVPDFLEARARLSVRAEATDATSWNWAQVEGPGTVVWGSSTSAETTIETDKDGLYTLSVSASNEQGLSSTATIHLRWDTEGPSVQLTEELRTFQKSRLEAQLGTDAARKEWTQISGPGTLQFAPADQSFTEISANIDGTYIARLNVWDSLGNLSSADVRVIWDTVGPAVSAGQDLIAGAELLLDASSMDAISWQWTQVSGPGNGQLLFSAPTSEDTRVRATVDGRYTLRFTVTKASGASAYDEMNLLWDTTAPQLLLPSAVEARLRARLSARVNEPLQLDWLQLSGPGRLSFSHPHDPSTVAISDLAGSYSVALRALDSAGNKSEATLLLTLTADRRLIASSLSAGGDSTCAVFEDGGLGCWGYADDGELGYGDRKQRSAPPIGSVALPGALNATGVAMGFAHGCAVLSDGSLRCWGSNSSGQLGYGDKDPKLAPSLLPVPAASARPITSVAAGLAHTCALYEGGEVRCWGANASGQLGYGDRTPRLQPPAEALNFGAGRSARAISLGAEHSCALLDDATLRCWGSNAYGQLGYGDRFQRLQPDSAPVPFSQSFTARTMVAGSYHSCALSADAKLSCWGRNQSGQLGYGDKLGRPRAESTFLLLPDTFLPAKLSAGPEHTCALDSEGGFLCWGRGTEGQLGLSDSLDRLSPPLEVLRAQSPRRFRSLSLGGQHSCALLDDGTVNCWGSNSYGQLGRGVGQSTDILSPVLHLSAQDMQTSALLSKSWPYFMGAVQNLEAIWRR